MRQIIGMISERRSDDWKRDRKQSATTLVNIRAIYLTATSCNNQTRKMLRYVHWYEFANFVPITSLITPL